MAVAPGMVRDALFRVLQRAGRPGLPLQEIYRCVSEELGHEVATSSVRSSLNHRTDLYEKTSDRGYRLIDEGNSEILTRKLDKATIVHDDAFNWLKNARPQSVHAVVTDPPYGLVEYEASEQRKLRAGKGGVWRVPPSFDGTKRAPLPRFSTLTKPELMRIESFFGEFAELLEPVLVPGAHVFIAANPLVSHLISYSMAKKGFERRGEIIRLVQTMRGGDRPKNAHEEFSDVSVMPRSMWEPWLLFRKPVEGTVAENLREWGTGGLRRISDERPFGDVIKSSPTNKKEREIAPHPSLKPQAFLREVVRGSLPLGKGVILDPFAGSGSTLAAANYFGYESIGIERDREYFELAIQAIPKLSSYEPSGIKR